MHRVALRGDIGRWSVAIALVIATSVGARVAEAQKSAQQTVEDLNRDAMEAYNALDINKAGSMLEEALRVAQQGGVVGAPLARTHLNLGVVLVGGVGDQDGGLNAFIAALCADASAKLDLCTGP